MQEYISVQGCKVHNLKNIDVKFQETNWLL